MEDLQQEDPLMMIESSDLENHYRLSQGIAQIEYLFGEIKEVIMISQQAKSNRPDLVNYPDALEAWQPIEKGLNQIICDQQFQYDKLQQGLSSFNVVHQLSLKLNNQLLKQDNPIESAELYKRDVEYILECSTNALAQFEFVNCRSQENLQLYMESLSQIVGQYQAGDLDRLKKQLQREIYELQDKMDSEIKRTDIMQHKLKVGCLLGNISEASILIKFIKDQIQQETLLLQHYNKIKTQLNNTLQQTGQEQINCLQNIQTQAQQNFAQINSTYEQQRIKKIQDQQKLESTINDKKQALILRINNPKKEYITETTYGKRKWYGGRNSWTSTRLVTEDVSSFKNDLSILQQQEAIQSQFMKQQISNLTNESQEQSVRAQKHFEIMKIQATQGEQQIKEILRKEIDRNAEYVTKTEAKMEKLTQQLANLENKLTNHQQELKSINEEVQKLEIEQKLRLEAFKNELEVKYQKLQDANDKEDQILKQLGFHSLEALFKNLFLIDQVIYSINKRKSIISEEIGFFRSFDHVMKQSLNCIPMCIKEFDTYTKNQDQNLPLLENTNCPINILKEYFFTILKNNEIAQEEFKDKEYDISNMITGPDYDDTIWEELNITRNLDKKLIKSKILQLRRKIGIDDMKVKLNKRLKSEYNQIEKILALLTRKRQKEINNDPNNELD